MKESSLLPFHAGRCHDSRVLKDSSLWESFEDDKARPFPEAVILGDSAYPLTDWLITPFPGEPGNPKRSLISILQ